MVSLFSHLIHQIIKLHQIIEVNPKSIFPNKNLQNHQISQNEQQIIHSFFDFKVMTSPEVANMLCFDFRLPKIIFSPRINF